MQPIRTPLKTEFGLGRVAPQAPGQDGTGGQGAAPPRNERRVAG